MAAGEWDPNPMHKVPMVAFHLLLQFNPGPQDEDNYSGKENSLRQISGEKKAAVLEAGFYR